MTAYDAIGAAQEEYEREGDAYLARERAWVKYGGDPLNDADRTFTMTGAETLHTVQALYRAVDTYTAEGNLADAGDCRHIAKRFIYTGHPVDPVEPTGSWAWQPEAPEKTITLSTDEGQRVRALIEGICGDSPFALSGEDVTALLTLVARLSG